MKAEVEVNVTVTFDAAERLEILHILCEYLKAHTRQSQPAAFALRDLLSLDGR